MINEVKKDVFRLRITLITVLLYAIAYLLLNQIFMFWETSWHIEGAKRMLSVGTYLTNLVDELSFCHGAVLGFEKSFSTGCNITTAQGFIGQVSCGALGEFPRIRRRNSGQNEYNATPI